MPFESNPLRVKLPCDDGVSLVDAPHFTLCAYYHTHSPMCRVPSLPHCGVVGSIPHCVPYNSGIPCRAPSLPDCLPASDPWRPDNPYEWVVIEVDPEDATTIHLRPEDLPRYRKQLQVELERIDALVERRGQIEEMLSTVDSIQGPVMERLREQEGEVQEDA